MSNPTPSTEAEWLAEARARYETGDYTAATAAACIAAATPLSVDEMLRRHREALGRQFDSRRRHQEFMAESTP